MRKLIERIESVMEGDSFAGPELAAQVRKFYLKGWDEHPSPDGKRMAYGREFPLGTVKVAFRIIQEDGSGKQWRVDRKGMPTWESALNGRVFLSAEAAAQALQGWWDVVKKQYFAFVKAGYQGREAVFKALDAAERDQ